MLEAADSVRENARHALEPCLRYSVMAVDEVVTARGDLRVDDRTRQVRCDHSQLIQPCAFAGGRNVVKRDEFGTKSSRSADVGRESGDIEFENPIGIDLVTLQRLARQKARVDLE